MSNDHRSYDQGYTDYQTDRSWLRRWIRGFYLRSAAAMLDGPAIDFGCGVGDMLRALPAGSTGLEINPASVEHCRSNGLDVVLYDADSDGWTLSPLAAAGRRYRSLVVSHVLEHLEEPVIKFNALLRAAERLGVEKALAIVPGKVGFASDATHLTFVDEAMLADERIVAGTGFRLQGSHHYPLDLRAVGDVFVYHELRALYVRDGAGGR